MFYFTIDNNRTFSQSYLCETIEITKYISKYNEQLLFQQVFRILQLCRIHQKENVV